MYEYLRDPALNANYWFNNRDLPRIRTPARRPRTSVTLNQFGGRFGGPIVMPGLFDGHDKAFFFFNFERHSADSGRPAASAPCLTPQAEQGIFRYSVAGEVRQVESL